MRPGNGLTTATSTTSTQLVYSPRLGSNKMLSHRNKPVATLVMLLMDEFNHLKNYERLLKIARDLEDMEDTQLLLDSYLSATEYHWDEIQNIFKYLREKNKISHISKAN